MQGMTELDDFVEGKGKYERRLSGPRDQEHCLAENWSLKRFSNLMTVFDYDNKLNGINCCITVVTPQNGTWGVSARIEIDEYGRGYIPKLAENYETREKAQIAATKLMLGLNCDEMVKQFILSHATGDGYKTEERSLEAVRNDLKQIN